VTNIKNKAFLEKIRKNKKYGTPSLFVMFRIQLIVNVNKTTNRKAKAAAALK